LKRRHASQGLVGTEIKGSLIVTDPHTFTRALTEGIGRARAYSAGLLLIRPAR